MDLRSIPAFTSGPAFFTRMVLEDPEPGFTVGNQYELWSLVVDSAPTPPQPYALMLNDTGHFKLVELSKVRRAG